MIKVNTDVSFLKELGMVGIGGVIRTENGDHIFASSCLWTKL